MNRKILSAAVVALILALGILADSHAATPKIVRDEPVTLILKNGDRIRATILDIWRDKLVFKASNWRDAYEYGEVIGVGQIAAIELNDGRRLSVEEFDDYRKGQLPEQQQEPQELAPPPPMRETRIADRVIVTRPTRTESSAEELDQYELLKRKPIAEMTDREFEFFMMMKRRELEAERLKEQLELEKQRRQLNATQIPEEKPLEVEPAAETGTLPALPPRAKLGQGAGEETKLSRPSSRRFGLRLRPDRPDAEAAEEMARLLIASDLAGPFLTYVAEQQDESLTPFQRKVVQAVESSPQWQERVEQVEYLRRVAAKAVERVFLYEPESLKNLGLRFDENADIDFDDLLRQLHGKLGNNVHMGDFRILVDVLGEGGARAVRDLLRNFDTYNYIAAAGRAVAGK